MSDEDTPQNQQPQEPPHGATARRPPRSGEGMDSVLAHLRQQEAERLQDDPTTRDSGGN